MHPPPMLERYVPENPRWRLYEAEGKWLSLRKHMRAHPFHICTDEQMDGEGGCTLASPTASRVLPISLCKHHKAGGSRWGKGKGFTGKIVLMATVIKIKHLSKFQGRFCCHGDPSHGCHLQSKPRLSPPYPVFPSLGTAASILLCKQIKSGVRGNVPILKVTG